MNKSTSQKKPLVGFFPPFSNLAETGRALLVAKRYRELGGRAIFFSHGGKYEFLAKDNDFQVTRVKPFITEEQIEEYFRIMSLEMLRPKTLDLEGWIFENVKEEISAFKKTRIKLLVSTNNVTCAISARAVNIPYINIIPGGGNFAISIPDTIENPFTLLIPQVLKTKFLNILKHRVTWHLKPINKVARKVGAPTFKVGKDVWRGDFTFVTDCLEFINVFPNQQNWPTEDYIGMILLDELFVGDIPLDETKKIDAEIEEHLKKSGRSILISLGSSGTKDLFLRILKTLNKTNYNVIAIYTYVLDEKDLPKLNDNILLKKFVPSIRKVNSMIDLAIIHGGQGTVYTAVYSKKPVIGFPMHIEQHINLEKLVGHGSGLMLSKKYFNEKKLLKAINKIFSNYDKYLTNAQNLASKLPPPEGDKIAAQRILKIVTDTYL